MAWAYLHFLYLLLHSATVHGECVRFYCNVSNCDGITCYSCLDGYYLSFGGCSACLSQCTKCNEYLDCTECALGYWGYLCDSSCFTCTNGCDIDSGTCLEDTANPEEKSDESTNQQTNPTRSGGENTDSTAGQSDEGMGQTHGNVIGLAVGLSITVVVIAVIIVVFGLYNRQRRLRKQLQNLPTAATPSAPAANSVASDVAVQYTSAPPPPFGQYLTPIGNNFNQPPYAAQTPGQSPVISHGHSLVSQSPFGQNVYPDSSRNVPSAPQCLEPEAEGSNFHGDMAGSAFSDFGTVDSGYVEITNEYSTGT